MDLKCWDNSNGAVQGAVQGVVQGVVQGAVQGAGCCGVVAKKIYIYGNRLKIL